MSSDLSYNYFFLLSDGTLKGDVVHPSLNFNDSDKKAIYSSTIGSLQNLLLNVTPNQVTQQNIELFNPIQTMVINLFKSKVHIISFPNSWKIILREPQSYKRSRQRIQQLKNWYCQNILRMGRLSEGEGIDMEIKQTLRVILNKN